MEINGRDKSKNSLNRTQRNNKREWNKTKSQAFEKLNETDKPLVNLIKMKNRVYT